MGYPHPIAYRNALWLDTISYFRAWPYLWIQIPYLGLNLFKHGEYIYIKNIWATQLPIDAFDWEDIATMVRGQWNYKKGMIQSMIYWFTASNSDYYSKISENNRVKVPTKIIWGNKDIYYPLSLMESSKYYCDNVTIDILDAGHWLPNDQYQAITKIIKRFIDT